MLRYLQMGENGLVDGTAVGITIVKTPLLSELPKNAWARSTRNPLFSQPPIAPQPLIILTSNYA